MGELLEVSHGAWFSRFDVARHVSEEAAYHPAFPVHLAIDCGVSRHTAAVSFQVHGLDPLSQRVTVFGEWHGEGLYSEAAAEAILARSQELPCAGRLDAVRLDPASAARTGIGPAAYGAFERALRRSVLAQWPRHRVADGLDQLEVLLDQGLLRIHSRCAKLQAAFRNHVRKQTSRGDWLDEPADPQHPHEDLIDALRGGVRDQFPEGRPRTEPFRRVPMGRIF